MVRVPTYTEIGERIREVRISKGYDQSDLAAELKVSRPVVTKIENGKKAINSIELITIANFLNVSVDSLIGSVEEESLCVRFRNIKNTKSFNKAVSNIEKIIHSVITQIELGSHRHA